MTLAMSALVGRDPKQRAPYPPRQLEVLRHCAKEIKLLLNSKSFGISFRIVIYNQILFENFNFSQAHGSTTAYIQ